MGEDGDSNGAVVTPLFSSQTKRRDRVQHEKKERRAAYKKRKTEDYRLEIADLKRENKELSNCKKKCEDLTIEKKMLGERNLDLMQQHLRLKQDTQDTQQRYLQDIELLEKERQGLLILS